MKIKTYAPPLLAMSAVLALAYAFNPRRSRVRAGQVVLVTGGSRGLGLAIARRFGREGVKLVLTSRKQDELEKAKASLLAPGKHGEAPAVRDADSILIVPADLTERAQAARVVATTIERFGRLDLLINDAGIMEVGPVENQPIEAYERAMQINFFGALYMIDAALPHLLRRTGAEDASEPRGICNIASVGGKIAVPHMLPYVASKFALTGFSEGLHAELRSKGVRVTTVCPGLLRTGGEAHAKFVGQTKKEQRWFDLGAKTPIVAASVESAANSIFEAVNNGRAEITITPQAWLGARVMGLAPELSQGVAALANQYILPAPAAGGNGSQPA